MLRSSPCIRSRSSGEGTRLVPPSSIKMYYIHNAWQSRARRVDRRIRAGGVGGEGREKNPAGPRRRGTQRKRRRPRVTRWGKGVQSGADLNSGGLNQYRRSFTSQLPWQPDSFIKRNLHRFLRAISRQPAPVPTAAPTTAGTEDSPVARVNLGSAADELRRVPGFRPGLGV